MLRTGEKIGPARSSRAVGTNQPVFCFHGDCGRLSGRGVGLAHSVFDFGRDRRDACLIAAGAAPAPRGVDDLSFENEGDHENERRPKTDVSPLADSEDTPRKNKRRGSNSEIGQALRQAYSDAVEESVPPEFLDLLGRLG
jgi:hypothetical protein